MARLGFAGNVRLPTCVLAALQAIVSMHAYGRGMSDVKPENIMVQVAEDGVTVERVTLLDLGSSAIYTGMPQSSHALQAFFHCMVQEPV